MTCPQDRCTDYLGSSAGPPTASGLSRLLGGAPGHGRRARWLRGTARGSPALWRRAKPLVRPAAGRRRPGELAALAVEEPVLEKPRPGANELKGAPCGHGRQRLGQGLGFVGLLRRAGGLARPVGGEPVAKAGPVPNAKPPQTGCQGASTRTECRPAGRRLAREGGKRKNTVSRLDRSPEQVASMGRSPAETPATRTTHFFTTPPARGKLEALKIKRGLGYFRLGAQPHAVGLKAMYQQLAQLTASQQWSTRAEVIVFVRTFC